MDTALLVRLILLLPFAGAICIGLGGLFFPSIRPLERLIGTLATALVGIPFGIAVWFFVTYGGDPVVVESYTWMAAGDFRLLFAYRIDELSLIMTMIVTGVGGIIHLYSIGYMRGDRGYWRYFAFLNLFIFAMLNLVMADNLLVMFLGWEGVGLCSWLLIGFWYTDLKNSAAANKAFIMNRVGDFAFLLALFILYKWLGTLDFEPLLEAADTLPPQVSNWVVLLLFIGATGKSAQIPLFTWLPDAMAGPTPVSALIHAATMVTSGLYLLARLSPLVLEAPAVMVGIAVVGALTAVTAATIAITQNDIKKVLAYSTVSQLGYMFASAGVGAFFVSIFHVMTHAFFKGCLFLGSGSVIHAMHGVEHRLQKSCTRDDRAATKSFDPQDMRTMGGLARYMPSTSRTYLIAALALAGIPPLAGFFSKDEILFRVFEQGFHGHAYAWFVWVLGVVTAFLTAFYMMRAYVLTFQGKPRWPRADAVHPRESPPTMTVPLWILAMLAIVGGFLGLPAVIGDGDYNWIHSWLGASHGGPVAEPPVIEHAPRFVEWGLLLLGALIAVFGTLLAAGPYLRFGPRYDQFLAKRLRGVYRVWKGKYHVDEFYERTVVRPVVHLAEEGLAVFDDRVVDGAVNGLARLTAWMGRVLRTVQTGRVQHYAVAIAFGAVLVIACLIFA